MMDKKRSCYLLLYHTNREALFNLDSSHLIPLTAFCSITVAFRFVGINQFVSFLSRSNLLNSENQLLEGYPDR